MSDTPAQSSSQPDRAGPAAPAGEVDIFCPFCGYNVRGLTVERCPECGKAFDLERLRESQIPWMHRDRLGRRRAFRRTVQQVVFHPRRFSREVARPVSLPDARRLRRRVMVRLVLAAAIGLVAVAMASQSRGFQWSTGTAVLVVIPLYLLVGVPVCTGMARWFCAPKRLDEGHQNRAAALSYYGSAPLAYLPLLVVLGLAAGGGLAYVDTPQVRYDLGQVRVAEIEWALGAVVFIATGAALGALLSWLVSTVAIVCASTQRSASGSFAIFVATALLWTVVPAVLVGTVVLGVTYWTLMYYSLR